MATTSDITAALGGGSVQDLTETEFVSFVGTLAAAIVDVVTAEHEDDGEHLLKNGTIAERPAAGTAGKVYVATTDAAGNDISDAPTVYIDNGTAWTNVTDLSANRLIYTNAQHTSLTKIYQALDYILTTFNAGGTIKGSSVIVEPTDPQVISTGGTLDDVLEEIDGFLDEFMPENIPVTYGTSMTLQAAITSIRNSLTALATPIIWNGTDFDHIQETDTTWTAIIQRLDNAIRKEGVSYTSDSFTHAPLLGTGIYGNTSGTLKAVLDAIESATSAYADTQILTAFFPGALTAYTTDIDGTNHQAWSHAWLIPEDTTGTGLLGDCYVDQFYARIVTSDPNDDVTITFKLNTFSGLDPAGPVQITIAGGNYYVKDVANALSCTGAEYNYIGVHLLYEDATVLGNTASDLMISCRLVKLRNMSDWTA